MGFVQGEVCLKCRGRISTYWVPDMQNTGSLEKDLRLGSYRRRCPNRCVDELVQR